MRKDYKMKKIMLMVVAAVASFSVHAYTVTAKAVGALDTAMGSVQIKQGEEVVVSGSDLTGSVTITATAKDANRPFVKWLGSGITDAQRTSATLTIDSLASDVNIVPVFAGMWLYEVDSENSAIGTLTEFRNDATEGWQLSVAKVNSTERTCALGGSDKRKLANAIHRVSAAYNSGEGELDISTPIVDADGNLWQITSWVDCSLAMNVEMENTSASSKSILTNEAIYGDCATNGFAQKIIVPKTLTSFYGLPFNGPCTGLKDLIINCPLAGGRLSSSFFGSTPDLTNLVIKIPKVDNLQDNNFCKSEAMKSGIICVDEWDFSGVTLIGNDMSSEGPSNWNGTFKNVKVKGTLRFPKVKNIGTRTFENFQTDGDLEFGFNGTITRIRNSAFSGNNFKVNRISFGGAPGWTMDGDAVSLKSVSQIIFTTDNAPTLLLSGFAKSEKMFLNDKAEKTVCFYVPKSIKWLNAIGTLLNKDDEGKYVIGAGAFFGATYGQYVSIDESLMDVGHLIPYSVKVADPRYGDKINVYVDGEQVLNEGVEISGSVTNGTVLRFEAVCKAGNVVHWKALNWGWKSDNVEETFVVTSDAKFGNVIKPVEIGLWSRHPWTFLPATEAFPTNRITDGIWTLNVCRIHEVGYEPNDYSTTLGIGAANSGRGHAFTGVGSGILDLNGIIKDASGTEYKIIGMLGNCLTQEADEPMPLTALVFPETYRKSTTQLFGSNRGNPHITTLIYDVPNIYEADQNHLFIALGNLQSLYINYGQKFGRVTDGVIPSALLNNTDRSVWDFENVGILEGGSFGPKNGSSSVNNREVLRFPRAERTGKGWYTGEDPAFGNIGVWGFEFGMAFNHEDNPNKILNVINEDFKNSPKLTSLKFGAYSNFTFNANAFTGCPSIEDITFTGKCLMTEEEARTLLDTILLSIPAKSETQKIQTIIRASMTIGWSQIRSDFADDAERADANALASWLEDGERIVGVYVTANNERKAWVVHKASEEYDPKGSIIIIR